MRMESFENFLGPIGYDEPMTKKQEAKEPKPAVKPEPRFEIPPAESDEPEFVALADAVDLLKPYINTEASLRRAIKVLNIITFNSGLGDKRKNRFLTPAQIQQIREAIKPKQELASKGK